MEKRTHYSNNSIPLDVWLQILTLFPIKTLLVLRAVCKSFLSMIDDPYFVSLRLRLIPENSLETRFLVYEGGSNGAIFQVRETHNLYTPRPRTRKTNKIIDRVKKPGFPNIKKPAPLWNLLRSSLNGLLLLSTTRYFCNLYRTHNAALLWNPSIKKHRQLSLPDTEALAFGLGYHPGSKDYKVLAFHASRGRDQAWVYSVKTKSWTDVVGHETDNTKFRCSSYYSMNYKEGVQLVWIENVYDNTYTQWNSKPRVRRLVRFDFETERFSYVDGMPPASADYNHHRLVMLDGGSTIGVWWVDESDYVFVWALGTDDMSWTLRYKLAPPHGVDSGYSFRYTTIVRPRLDEKNGELVWKYWLNGKSFKVVTYEIDVETQVHWKKDVGTVRECIDLYVESLVMAS